MISVRDLLRYFKTGARYSDGSTTTRTISSPGVPWLFADDGTKSLRARSIPVFWAVSLRAAMTGAIVMALEILGAAPGSGLREFPLCGARLIGSFSRP